MTIIIVCLEGCHGSGKSTLIQLFEKCGFPILDEGFLSMPNTILHHQTLLMETTWVTSWYQRLLGLAEKHNPNQTKIVFADRSPLSAILYAQRNGKLLEPLIASFNKEIAQAAHLQILTLHIHVERDTLWNRIQERLRLEPERLEMNENCRQWMDKVCDMYDMLNWDDTVYNNDDLKTVAHSVLQKVVLHAPSTSSAIEQYSKVLNAYFSGNIVDGAAKAPSTPPVPTVEWENSY